MSDLHEDSVITSPSPIGPRTKTLAEFEYKGLLSKKPQWRELYAAVTSKDSCKVRQLLDSTDIKLDSLENRVFTKLLLGSAIEDDNDEILEILINKGAKIGGILFTAIRESSYKCVKCIVKIIQTTHTDSDDLGPSDSKDEGFITPLMMAIHSDEYDIIEYLITQDYKIEKPEYTYFEEAKNELNIDIIAITRTLGIPLKTPRKKKQFPKEHSILLKINTYQALANPLYISYMFIHNKTTVNPMFEIFQLSRALRYQASKDEEFKEEYNELLAQCEDFAVDLMEQCRTFKEIKFLTDVLPEFEKRKRHIEIRNDTAKDLAFLNLAIKENNDKLVAHPYSQLCLNMVLYKNVYTIFRFEPNWRDRSSLSIFAYTVRHILLLPFLALIHVIAPCTRVSGVLENPVIKFMSHFWSMLFFVVLLLVSAFQDKFDNSIFRPGIPDWLIMAWVLGLIVQEFKELFIQGKRRYFTQWWNAVTFFMVLLFTLSYILRLIAFGITGNWAVLDPIKLITPSVTFQILLLSNSLFSIAMVLSFIRLSAAFQASGMFGPLQLSLYYLILDVAKFMVFFALIIVAFGFSLRKLYSHYIIIQKHITAAKSTNSSVTHPFSDVSSGLNGLFWSLFGLTELQSFSTKGNNFVITKETGQVLFGLFQVLAVIIAINMLIAMMTRSFDDIASNAIKKWKVSRTRLWMFWVEKGSVLPPPLNLIPNIRFVYHQLKRQCKCCQKETFDVEITDDFTDIQVDPQQEMINYAQLKHRKLKDIAKRYIGMRKIKDKVDSKSKNTDHKQVCCDYGQRKLNAKTTEKEEDELSTLL